MREVFPFVLEGRWAWGESGQTLNRSGSMFSQREEASDLCCGTRPDETHWNGAFESYGKRLRSFIRLNSRPFAGRTETLYGHG